MGVYVIGARGSGLVKIGYSASSERRLVKLQAGSPFPLMLLRWWPDMTRADEARLHLELGEWRRYGEWFAVSPQVREALDLPILPEHDAWMQGYEAGRRDEHERLERARAQLRALGSRAHTAAELRRALEVLVGAGWHSKWRKRLRRNGLTLPAQHPRLLPLVNFDARTPPGRPFGPESTTTANEDHRAA
jgi:hypothetical protein